jgi:hypothetical protein
MNADERRFFACGPVGTARVERPGGIHVRASLGWTGRRPIPQRRESEGFYNRDVGFAYRLPKRLIP